MRKVIENGFLIFILLITVFFSWRSCAQIQKPVVSIKKAFHHQGTANKCANIEAGSLVLYFNVMPATLPVSHKSYDGEFETQTFFLPSIVITQEAKRMIDRINNDHAQPYTLTISSVHGQNKGVQIVIKYPRNAYMIESKQFEAIGKDQGFIFYIYNQKVLDALRARQEPLMKMASTGRHPPCIFIDNGHGGGDAGAIGHDNVKEKDISLHVGTQLAHLLQRNGFQVVMSRTSDQDVPLDQRTTEANRSGADILISIHANSASNKNTHGIETFCTQPRLFTRLYSEMDRESKLCVDRIVAQRSQQSDKLARLVQKSICFSTQPYQKAPFDRGVKYAVAQVFLAQVPAILVELGFLTNPIESALLTTDTYQQVLAQSLFNGIRDYFQSN